MQDDQNDGEYGDSPVKLDAVDRKILAILQQNARASTREVAKAIGNISKVAIAYRIRKLVAQRVIEGFTTKVNGTLLGQDYIFFTRLVSSEKGPKEKEVCEKIAKFPGVQSVYQMFGPYDIMVIGRAKNRQAARDLIYKMYNLGGIESTETLVPHTAVKESVDINLFDEK